MRITLLISVAAVALVACSPQAGESAVAIGVADFMIEPDDLTAAGPMITLEVTNDGPTPHNLTIRNDADEVVAATADLSAGESETLGVELEPGSYTIFCSLAGHESLGMSGILTVTGS